MAWTLLSARLELISIHTPRVGSDSTIIATGTNCTIISIHTPREGSDGRIDKKQHEPKHFNPHSP